MKRRNRRFNDSRPIALLAALCLVTAITSAARAEQFWLIDTVVVHDIVPNPPYKGWHSHLNLVFKPGVPVNWKSPINYYEGIIFSRYEIMEKPTDRQATYQMCFNRDGNKGGKWHTCTACTREDKEGNPVAGFTEPGTYYVNDSPAWIWAYKKPDYTKFENGYPQLVLKGKPDGGCDCPVTSGGLAKFHCWDGYPDMTLHYPIKLRISAIVVAKDDGFDEPAWWYEDHEVSAKDDRVRNAKLPAGAGFDVRLSGGNAIDVSWQGLRPTSAELIRADGRRLEKRALIGGPSALAFTAPSQGLHIVRLHGDGYSVQRSVLVCR